MSRSVRLLSLLQALRGRRYPVTAAHLAEPDLRPWLGTRAQAGRMVPNGFPRSNRFG